MAPFGSHGESRNDRLAETLHFIIRLSEATRPLSAPEEITAACASMLGRHLRADRCAYCEVEQEHDSVRVLGDYTCGIDSLVGEYRLSDFGEDIVSFVIGGKPLVVEDIETHVPPLGRLVSYRRLDIRAFICVPLIKEGRFTAAVSLQQRVPRTWKRDEVDLVAYVANRCWDALERARADRLRGETEAALKQSEQRFKMLADSAPVLIWVSDLNNGVVWLNKHWSSFTGRPLEIELGTGWLDGVHPDDRARIRQFCASRFVERREFKVEFRLRHRSGEYRWLLDHGIPLYGVSGEFTGYIGSCIDITDRKRAEAAMARYNERLEHEVAERARELGEFNEKLRFSERLAALGTLSAGLGHDMGNLLMPIQVRLAQLERAGLPGAALDKLRHIRDSTEYLQRLASGLRLMSLDPEHTVSHEITELAAWWSEAGPVLKNVLPRKITLEARIPEGEVAISRPALTQIVFNLIQNAADAMKSQTEGRISLSFADVNDERIALELEDTGPGMSADVKAHCMEPFFTTKTRSISTGLGLALVHALVQRAGGTVEISSEAGRGTTFRITLRRAVAAGRHGAYGKKAVVAITDLRLRSFIRGELNALKVAVHDTEEGDENLIVTDDPHTLEHGVADGTVLFIGEPHAHQGAGANGMVRYLGRDPLPSKVRMALREVLE